MKNFAASSRCHELLPLAEGEAAVAMCASDEQAVVVVATDGGRVLLLAAAAAEHVRSSRGLAEGLRG